MKSIFVNKSGFIRSGWSVILGIITYPIIPLFIDLPIYFIYNQIAVSSGNPKISLDDPKFTAVKAIGLILTAIALMILFRLLYRKPLSEMGFDKKHAVTRFLHGVAIGVVSISLAVLSFSLFGKTTYTWVGLNSENAKPIILNLFLMLSVGFCEETLGRGYIMTAMRTTNSKILVFISSSVIFSFMHFANAGFSWIPALNLFLSGMAFAYLFVRTGSLWASIGYHFAWNFMQGSGWGFAVSGNELSGTLIHTSTEAPSIIAGGVFGPEGGLATTVVTVLIILYTRFVVKKEADPMWTMDPLVKNAPVLTKNAV
jgi:membrane protease YdiL (CAAX protease family)